MKIDLSNYLTLSPERTMEIVLDAIGTVVPYELAVVLSLEKGSLLKVRCAQGTLYTPRLEHHTICLKERPELGKIVEAGEVKLFDEEDDNHHQDTYHDIIDLPSGHSCMVAPLHVEGKILGILTLDNSQCNIFKPEIVELTKTLAKIIALALAQTLAANALQSERDVLLYERNALLQDLVHVGSLIGTSPPWLSVLEKIRLVASTDSPVIIIGETGTGKEQVARAVHSLSNRANRPFIALNCSALQSNLAESELFGHEKGAFTGAVSRRKGRFELAHGGTLFLDEIADLPLDIQPKLLRTLQEETFDRVGGEVSLRSDVRIICATHVHLPQAIEQGKFREDLFYRLNVFPISLPPLRDRKDDVLLLANHFLVKLAKKFQKERFILSPSAVKYLKSQKWTGNVRELQNIMERAAIVCAGEILEVTHLSGETPYLRTISPTKSNLISSSQNFSSLDQSICEHIEKALHISQGKIYGEDGAANLLGLKPTTLQSKIRKYGIDSNARRKKQR